MTKFIYWGLFIGCVISYLFSCFLPCFSTDYGKVLPGTKGFERASSWDKTWNKYCSHK